MPDEVWYIGYGSNMNAERLGRYASRKNDQPAPRAFESRWLTMPYPIYFAGRSKTWGGPVAFCGLTRTQGVQTIARAYLVSVDELLTVLGQENGRTLLNWQLQPGEKGEWQPLPVALAEDGTRGKYNAVLRLDDIDNRPAYTVTTSHVLNLGTPTAEYVDTILGELHQNMNKPEIEHLRTVWSTSALTQDNRGYLSDPGWKQVLWSGEVVVGKTAGIPVIRLPREASGCRDEVSLRLGETRWGNRRIHVWVSYSLEPDGQANVTSDVARALGMPDPAVVQVESTLPVLPRRLPGYATDIPALDVIQVSPNLASTLGRWALVHVADTSAPVRVESRTHVPPGAVRVAYGLRSVLSLNSPSVQLCPLDLSVGVAEVVGGKRPHGVKRLAGRLKLAARGVGEWLMGAPPVAFRATEGLVGDDGYPVVRVDSTALDYLGLASGDQAIISWGSSSSKVRVLLQTDETKVRMQAQLSESTGMQARASLGDPAARANVPAHLRAWVSPRVRHQLSIPPDTLIRLRRSVSQVTFRGASNLVIPIVGLAVAALAVPDVPRWIWLAVLGVTVILAFMPLRMSRGSRRLPVGEGRRER